MRLRYSSPRRSFESRAEAQRSVSLGVRSLLEERSLQSGPDHRCPQAAGACTARALALRTKHHSSGEFQRCVHLGRSRLSRGLASVPATYAQQGMASLLARRFLRSSCCATHPGCLEEDVGINILGLAWAVKSCAPAMDASRHGQGGEVDQGPCSSGTVPQRLRYAGNLWL